MSPSKRKYIKVNKDSFKGMKFRIEIHKGVPICKCKACVDDREENIEYLLKFLARPSNKGK